METSVPCYSPGDVLTSYICSSGQQKSDIRKFLLGAGYVVDNLSLSIVVQINLSNFPPDIALHALHCEMMVILRNSARSSMDYVVPRANFKDLYKIRLNQFSKFKMYKREHNFWV